MKEIPTAPLLPNAPPTQDFSKLGFVYITVLGLANQAVPHTGSWRPLATALNYLVQIAPIVYMAFQARPASPVGAQPDSDMGRDTTIPWEYHLCPRGKSDPAKVKAITSMPPPTNVGQVQTFLGMVA
ncbi:hypothetical protein DSO57_1017162 [Entomophthora muscae]|uniref:Uncharacterized protein n=1 Tax=Entomophthora muscae TaxID=34485 RepID=A0ACC2RVW0_9FUNG|nr:hypothetical protein DSO57_1017162 [Entomophthora muscae]